MPYRIDFHTSKRWLIVLELTRLSAKLFGYSKLTTALLKLSCRIPYGSMRYNDGKAKSLVYTNEHRKELMQMWAKKP
jgi:hypothetical protein